MTPEAADSAQKNDLFKSQRGAKATIKSKTVPRAVSVMYKPKISTCMNSEMKARPLKVTETVEEEQANMKENYSFIWGWNTTLTTEYEHVCIMIILLMV